MERGRKTHRMLDVYAGIPLAAAAAIVRRTARAFAPTEPSPERARSVGVLCLGAIGDLLLATALLNGLRRELPKARIEVLTSRANAAAHSLLPPGIKAAAYAVKDVRGLVGHARAAGYNLLFDTGQWARVSALVAALSGAGRTVGFSTGGQYRHYGFDVAVPHRGDRHEVENFLALGRALFPGLEGSPAITVPERVVGDIPLPEGGGAVFCHMWPSGMHSHLKEWPAEHWGQLASALLDAGYSVIFTGGPGDAAATDAFMDRFVPVREKNGAVVLSVAGKLPLADLARLLRESAAVVSVNTGIMHLAAITGAPTIALNGPTNPLRWGPLGPETMSLSPREGRFAYLNLGFEYGKETERVLRRLPASDVMEALRSFGVRV